MSAKVRVRIENVEREVRARCLSEVFVVGVYALFAASGRPSPSPSTHTHTRSFPVSPPQITALTRKADRIEGSIKSKDVRKKLTKF